MKFNKARFLGIAAMILIFLIAGFKGERHKAKFDFYQYWNHSNDFDFEVRYNKDYKTALAHFKWMEENGNQHFPGLNDYLNAAICYAKIGDTTLATKCLRKSVLKGFLNIDDDNAWARNEIGEKSFNEIRKELPQLKQEYYVQRAAEMEFLLEEKKHSSIDQFVRSESVTKFLSASEKARLCEIADSINISEFISSVKKGESPPTSWLIYHLYGANDQYTPFIDSCFKIELFAGRVSPSAYSFWYDRQNVWVENKPQKFGMYKVYNPNRLGGEILSVDSIDIYRNQIGLQPLWKDALLKEFDLPNGYQKK